jgi:hypothetical protein
MLMTARFTLMAICHPISVTNLQSTLRPQGYCDAEAEWKALFTSLAGQLANDVNELLTALC